MKICPLCKETKEYSCFSKLKSSKDGYAIYCRTCNSIKNKQYRERNVEKLKLMKKNYREKNKNKVLEHNKKYYDLNKISLKQKNKIYREEHKNTISEQRKQYREKNKEHIKMKNKEYLPIRSLKIKERRKVDFQYKISQNCRQRIRNLLSRKKSISSVKLIGCNLKNLMNWLEFLFDENMSWNNYGDYWQIDHILPVNYFNLIDNKEQKMCFNWKNCQPLEKTENRSKSDKLKLHYYFNSLISLNRFITTHKLHYEYQGIKETLYWLREKLRYGKNFTDITIGNPQPSS